MIDALDSINIAFRQRQSRELKEYFQGESMRPSESWTALNGLARVSGTQPVNG
jgi:hypothetical protein